LATTDEQGVALIDALEAVLRPLMPLFRTFGVTHLDLSEMLARVFVYDTAESLAKEGRPPSPARLAIMNGLTRGEVDKHLAARDSATRRRVRDASKVLGAGAVLTIWNTDSRFSTPYGVAVDLPLKPGVRQRSFEDLVKVASPDLDAEVVLDELVAAGCAQIHQDAQFVSCTSRAYIPAGVGTDRISRVGTVLGGLASNMTRNLLLSEGDFAYPERMVASEFPVSEDGRQKIREWLTTDGIRFLETLDAWMNVHQDELKAGSGQRVGVSLFMHDLQNELASGTINDLSRQATG
jgi:Family of unknown function (DUF6502)